MAQQFLFLFNVTSVGGLETATLEASSLRLLLSSPSDDLVSFSDLNLFFSIFSTTSATSCSKPFPVLAEAST